MKDEIILRKATEKDVPAMSLMLDSIYSIKRPHEFYSWVLFDSVFPSVLMCGYSGKEFIGMFGIQKRKLTNSLICGQAIGLNIAPAWRGKGYFARLGNLSIKHFNDLDILSVFANSKALMACSKGLDFKPVAVIDTMVMDISRKSRSSKIGIKCENIDKNTVIPEPGNHKNRLIMFENSSKNRFWRYALNPMYSYSIINTSQKCFAIVKRFIDPDSGICFGDIVDYECPLDNEKELNNLFLEACMNLGNEGASKVTTWAISGTYFKNIIRNIGFKESGHKTYFCLKALNAKHSELYDSSRWHLKQCDTTTY